MAVACRSGATGTWYADSAFQLYESIPSGSFEEGNLYIGVPGDCVDPVVRAKPVFSSGDSVVDWPVPIEARTG